MSRFTALRLCTPIAVSGALFFSSSTVSSGRTFTGGVTSTNGGGGVIVVAVPTLDEESLTQSYGMNYALPSIAATTINGAHHRLLFDSPSASAGWRSWVTGDYANFDEIDTSQTIGEIGISNNFGIDNFRLGLGLGQTAVDQDSAFGGGSKIEGEFAVVEANYALAESKLILSSLLYHGDFDVETVRGYSGATAKSTGDTDAKNTSVRLRLDWKDAFESGVFSFTPRISYTFSNYTADAYTESNGFSPASFSKQEGEDHEIRIGLDIDYDLREDTSLRGILEVVYREADRNEIRGTSAFTPFSIQNQDLNVTWVRVGIEAAHKVNESINIHGSLFVSTEGQDASQSAALGLNYRF